MGLTQNRLSVSLRFLMASRFFTSCSSSPAHPFTSGPPGFRLRRGSCRGWNNQNSVSASRTLVPSSSSIMMREAGQESARSNAGYSSDQTQVVVDPVLKGCKLYIGSYGRPALLHHLVNEMLVNAVGEAQAGFASVVNVVLAPDGSSLSVTDNGRGVPTDINPMTKESAMEFLCAGGLTDDTYIVPGGLYRVGLSVVNALSEALEVTTWHDGREYQQKYSCGKPTTTVISVAEPHDRQGTRIAFWPDKEVFTVEIQFDYDTIGRRIMELAFLNPELTITLGKEGNDPEKKSQYQEYYYPGGLKDFVRYLNSDRKPLHDDILGFRKEVDGDAIDVAFQWCEDVASDTVMLGYANGMRSIEGGTHIGSMQNSLRETINDILEKKSKLTKEIDGYYFRNEHIWEGLTSVISVKLSNPEFEGLAMTRLVNYEVIPVVNQFVQEYLTEYLELHPDVLDSVHAKSVNVRRAACAARRVLLSYSI